MKHKKLIIIIGSLIILAVMIYALMYGHWENLSNTYLGYNRTPEQIKADYRRVGY